MFLVHNSLDGLYVLEGVCVDRKNRRLVEVGMLRFERHMNW